MSDVIAIIPARAESKSIKDKNIMDLSGYPLLAYSIAAAKLSKAISRLLVSTDSVDYAALAVQYGAEAPFLRPKEISGERSTDLEFFIHAIEQLRHEGQLPEYWAHLRPTTPLRDPRIIDKAVDRLIANNDATALRSGHKAPESPLKWLVRDERGYFKGFSGSSKQGGASTQPRQSFEDVYVPNGYIDVVRTSHILKGTTLHGDRMLSYETPPCSEVDSLEEHLYIQYQLDRDGSPLLDFLKARHPR